MFPQGETEKKQKNRGTLKSQRGRERMRKCPEGKWQGTSVLLDGATLAVMQEYVRVRSQHH